ncbi:lipid-A-disaccharide synthase [Aureimonas fodinaquatilis]|uniref:Lipid-A-disaccharide synthase n=1 Tax=Aureimonas fodinaquatilis TaxID=2565783 RepID=A0A5B0DVV9_9HYPH|nr:lipid-A-disaccharide synthase [Aureimonas fodinaquatilis]KAA0970488.1 lipid-A-disaccharide synthase [Aureimonas fodinaquatilis]
MKIGFVVGEESADRIGADLIRGLAKQSGAVVEPVGLGGRAMAAQGLNSLFDIEELSIIGIGAIVARLPQLMRRLSQTTDYLLAQKPDAVVTIDSFTFTNRVATRLRKAQPDLPIINVVPPAVWAYRPKRLEALAAAVDHSICLFPFEPAIFRELNGPPATYAGHPLMSEPHLQAIWKKGARTKPATLPVLLILPGSRRGEINRLMDDFGSTFAALKQRMPELRAILPVVPRVQKLVEQKLASWPHKPELAIGDEAKWQAFAVGDAALAASGTVALELALAGVPMALGYRLDGFTYQFRHLITGWTAALPNYVVDHPLVPEHFHEFVRPELLSRCLERLLTDTPERAAQMAGFDEVRRRMAVSRPPEELGADVILQTIADKVRG